MCISCYAFEYFGNRDFCKLCDCYIGDCKSCRSNNASEPEIFNCAQCGVNGCFKHFQSLDDSYLCHECYEIYDGKKKIKKIKFLLPKAKAKVVGV
jgi:hypothetical protein